MVSAYKGCAFFLGRKDELYTKELGNISSLTIPLVS